MAVEWRWALGSSVQRRGRGTPGLGSAVKFPVIVRFGFIRHSPVINEVGTLIPT